MVAPGWARRLTPSSGWPPCWRSARRCHHSVTPSNRLPQPAPPPMRSSVSWSRSVRRSGWPAWSRRPQGWLWRSGSTWTTAQTRTPERPRVTGSEPTAAYAQSVPWTPAAPRFRPLRLVLSLLVGAVAVAVAGLLLAGVHVHSVRGALLAAALIGLFNGLLP